jgi:hypothetical protein
VGTFETGGQIFTEIRMNEITLKNAQIPYFFIFSNSNKNMSRERTTEGVGDETKFMLSDRRKLNIAPLLGHLEGKSC